MQKYEKEVDLEIGQSEISVKYECRNAQVQIDSGDTEVSRLFLSLD